MYRVCVVEDDELASKALCRGLELNEYEPVPVYLGAEAIEACLNQDLDLVLLDVGLPDIDGFEVCKRLKSNPKTADIPVIFCTAKGAADDVLQGYQLGAVDYITKPYNLPIVIVRLEAAMKHHGQVSGAGEIDSVLSQTSYTDNLTGLRTSHYLMERLVEEVEKAHRYDHAVSCVVFDVDEVTGLDEELGPVSMDDLLVEVGLALRSHSRIYDVLARYDGTVFAAVLPYAPLEDAVSYAKKIMAEVDSTTFSDPSFPTEIGLSIGIATCRNGHALGADYVFGEAMRGLLEAKSMPSDRIVARDLNSG